MGKEVYIHPAVRSIVINKLLTWNPQKEKNDDDVLDLIGYVEEIELNHMDACTRNIFDNMAEARQDRACFSPELQLPF